MSPILRTAALSAVLAWVGCTSPCETWAVSYCTLCGEQAQDYVCTCATDGSLHQGDYPDDAFPSEEDARIACEEFVFRLREADSDTEASCRASNQVLKIHGSNACLELAAPSF